MYSTTVILKWIFIFSPLEGPYIIWHHKLSYIRLHCFGSFMEIVDDKEILNSKISAELSLKATMCRTRKFLT